MQVMQFAAKKAHDELRLIKIVTKQLEDSILIEISDNAGGIEKRDYK